MEIWQLSATELTRQYRTRQLSPVEVVKAVLDRIEVLNPRLNAYLSVAAEDAMATARAAERAWSDGEDPPGLCGIPVSVKDTIEVARMPTTYGSLAFASHAAPDSEIARRLRAAGSAIVGKTNTSEFALSTHTHNRLGPPARNPWDAGRSAGGSSGGAAAAVAAGLAPIAVGTDSAGSIRLPAAYNGVFGFKPTFGLIPSVQQWRASPTRSHNGPLTRTVADAALAIEALADRPGLAVSTERDSEGVFDGRRVAVLDGAGDRRGANRLRAVIEETGAQVVEAGRPPPAIPPAEIGDGMWAFSGDHYAAAEKLCPGFWAKHAGQLTDYAAPIYRDGQSVPAWRYRTVLDLTQQYAAAVAAWFSDWDFVITPCAAPAALLPARTDDLGPRFATLTMWNLAGSPAASLPMGFDEHSVPLAGQLVARPGHDSVLLAACRHIEVRAPWARAWPDTAPIAGLAMDMLKEGSYMANTPAQQAAVGTVILSTSDMAGAVAFYRDVFGFQVMFADGDRWTAIDGNGARLALAGQDEQLGEPIVLAIKVADLDAALAAAIAAGAEQQSPPRRGEHETRVELLTPDGQLISLYTPRR